MTQNVLRNTGLTSLLVTVIALLMFGPNACSSGDQPELNDFGRNWLATVKLSNTTSHGTGIIVSRDGYIITNAHVANVARESGRLMASIETSGGRERVLPTKVIATDPEHDLALLNVDGHFENVVVIETNDRAFYPGDACYSIGFPLSLGKLVSVGYVRNVHFQDPDPAAPPMAHNAMILGQRMEPGTSGSGIFAQRTGRLVGLMSLMLMNRVTLFVVLDSPIVVPVRFIRQILERHGVNYLRP